MLTTIGIFVSFGMEYEAAWLTFLLIPFAVLPFTYVSSFLFTEDSAAQTVTMFLHFLTIAILSGVILGLRLAPSLERIGDSLNWWFKFIPTYTLANSI